MSRARSTTIIDLATSVEVASVFEGAFLTVDTEYCNAVVAAIAHADIRAAGVNGDTTTGVELRGIPGRDCADSLHQRERLPLITFLKCLNRHLLYFEQRHLHIVRLEGIARYTVDASSLTTYETGKDAWNTI